MAKSSERGLHSKKAKLIYCEDAYLNVYTPPGLFEAVNGNKYLITENNIIDDESGVKAAIALVHRHLPPFTWQALDQQPLESGTWHGRYQIRLLNALAEECDMHFPGVISTGDRHASIQCRHLDGRVQMINIGYVGRDGFEFRDFDGWAVESPNLRDAFFKQSPEGNTDLVLQPRLKLKRGKKGYSGLSNILKEMVKHGLMEKALLRPNSTKFSYRLVAAAEE